ncbi:hypothetical protein Ahy_B06g082760 [Arachis hypogaea]|uniref:Uncharacterized protein n=1 Tax=Arachis hypogaea TaxID=3818 RepID=A0A444YNW6_ARAHY|nr:hypothetical protein Ahy_B06g082760 [Arachis hypogaea]
MSPSDLKPPTSRTPSKPHRRITIALPPSNPSHRRCRDVIAVAREKRCVRKEARRGEKRRRLSVAVAVERSRRSCLSPPKEEPLPPSIVTGKHTVPPCLWSQESQTGEKGAATPVAAASYFYCEGELSIIFNSASLLLPRCFCFTALADCGLSYMILLLTNYPKLTSLPKRICDLISLRYLDIRGKEQLDENEGNNIEEQDKDYINPTETKVIDNTVKGQLGDREEITLDIEGEAIGPTDEAVNNLSKLGTVARNSDICPLIFTNCKGIKDKEAIWEYVQLRILVLFLLET